MYTETDTKAARGRQTYTCATENPEMGIFQIGKQNKLQNMCRNIYDHFSLLLFFSHFSLAQNLGLQKRPKSYQKTGLYLISPPVSPTNTQTQQKQLTLRRAL